MEKAVRSNLWSWALRQGIGIKIEKKEACFIIDFSKTKKVGEGRKGGR